MEFLLATSEQSGSKLELLASLQPETVDYRLINQTEYGYDKAGVLAMYIQLYAYFARRVQGYDHSRPAEHYDDSEKLIQDRYYTALHGFYTNLGDSYYRRLAMVSPVEKFMEAGDIRAIHPDLCRQWTEQPPAGLTLVIFSHDSDSLSRHDTGKLSAYTKQRREYTDRSVKLAGELHQNANSILQPRYAMYHEQLQSLLVLLDNFKQLFEDLETFHQNHSQRMQQRY